MLARVRQVDHLLQTNAVQSYRKQAIRALGRIGRGVEMRLRPLGRLSGLRQGIDGVLLSNYQRSA